MTDTLPEEAPSHGFVDPAVEASTLALPPVSRRARKRDRVTAETKIVSVLLARPEMTASWGFMMCSNTFPLRVGEITLESAARLQRGDEIIEINGVTPDSYETAIRQFQRARLHLELRLRRTCSGSSQRDRSQSQCNESPEHAASVVSASGSLTPTGNRTSADDSVSRHERISPASREPGHTPEQLVLDKILRSDEAHNGGDTGGGKMDALPGPLRSSMEVLRLPGSENVTNVWQDILDRRRAHASKMCDGDDDSRADVCTLLPKPARQVIYDRHSCPFTAAEGFTAEFHTAVQYVLTKNALSCGRDAPGSGPAPPSRGGPHRVAALLAQDIEAKAARRAEQIQKYRAENGFERRRDDLAAIHTAMLGVVAPHRAEMVEQQEEEAERYRQKQKAADEHRAAYVEATSSNKAERPQWRHHRELRKDRMVLQGPQAHDFPHSPAAPVIKPTGDGGDMATGGVLSRCLRLPTPPPPPPLSSSMPT
ncbi:putative formin [Trypanosoma grayi]|uniref:putative formin n=1 Tax=Trypanosoma grayi TaxID=71804 RepID=UPI0004F47908|nr:putative formin [Trypanosoma grayi]KEG10873.1 putative formin [Trypanosoma grayi]